MSAGDITKLCENLSLVDEDEDEAVLEMSEEASIDGVEDVDRSLVGKVLSGKKVNREAFKGLIEQIWNPFGQVEVELVGDNQFMFHFNNCEEQNQVWYRAPWHFGNSLIVLEKPVGLGNISKLDFDKADFGSRSMTFQSCIGKSNEVTMVGLKYERLPEFCFACGRIGHGIKECFDEEARKIAARTSGTSHDTEGNGFVSVKPGYLDFQKKSVPSSATEVRKMIERKHQETLLPVKGLGPSQSDNMCLDGLELEQVGASRE
ncbi:hypothetical protein EZV62_004983 [Acer yangbiense]|uniref:CCHC-type domain-containing protein n=1 Tax=Acer yangbiense TaxID=1000413 RepID=A0A5C7ILK5_9ROSI|nr:hypothetical protein EZV62_004983 [Acer yangbiense]